MTTPTTAAGRALLHVLDSLMAVVHGIATADLPENIAAQAKTSDQAKAELSALILAIEAEARAAPDPAPLDVERLARLIEAAIVDDESGMETFDAAAIAREYAKGYLR